MKLASVRLIAADIKSMVSFYEMVTDLEAESLAIGSAETVRLWKEGSAEPGANRTAYVEFQVDNIDAHYERLKDKVPLVHELKTMPWGTPSIMLDISSWRSSGVDCGIKLQKRS